MLRTQSDARLVDLVRAGHAAAFEAIVQRYRKPLLGYCSRLLPASRAEDAVQQTFLNAYQSMVSGDAELNLRPWLYRIAHNSSLNLLRQNGWSHEQLDENMDGVQRPDQALELRERLLATVAAVQALPERQRNAVLLREIDGLSYDEIAKALGVGDGAVRQLLHRARASLRAGLTAVTPVGLVERLSAAVAGTGGDPGGRVAEVTTGLGIGAGAAKLGAAVLATGAIATGVVAVPLVKHHRDGRSDRVAAADAAAAGPSQASVPSASRRTVQVDERGGGGSSGPSRRGESHHGRRNASGGGSGSGGPGSGRRESGSLRSGEGGGHNSGSTGQRQRQSGGGGENRSGTRRISGPGPSGELQTGGDDGVSTLSSDGGGEHSLGGDGGGSGDGGGGTITAPTGTAPAPVTTDGSGTDGGGSGSASGPESPTSSGSGGD